MKCPICSSNSEKIFSSLILGKYDVQYFQCKKCALVFTESPYWLKEAYSNAIAQIDTGIMNRNIANAIRINAVISLFYKKANCFLDQGGGVWNFY